MKKTIFAAVVAALLLAGCSTSVKVEKNDCLTKVAASEIAITESYESTVALLKAEVIDKEAAKTAAKAIDAANTAVDAAGRLCTLDETSALKFLAEAAKALIKANEILGE